MKKITLTLAFILVSIFTYAQGIAVQGIARDAQKSAITNEQKQFIFTISGPNSLYKESQSITTDAFGVFSHVVGTGTKSSAKDFDELNFTEQLKLTVEVDGIQVYDKAFEYTPYAHFAMNGVPTGTIVAFAGTTPPRGWLLCDGREIPAKYQRLRGIVNNNNKTPDLRGRFLRGAGTADDLNGKINHVNLGKMQDDQLKDHTHKNGTLKGGFNIPVGTDTYRFLMKVDGTGTTDDVNDDSAKIEANLTKSGDIANYLNSRTVNITGKTGGSPEAGKETRPYNYGVNYIIKY